MVFGLLRLLALDHFQLLFELTEGVGRGGSCLYLKGLSISDSTTRKANCQLRKLIAVNRIVRDRDVCLGGV